MKNVVLLDIVGFDGDLVQQNEDKRTMCNN